MSYSLSVKFNSEKELKEMLEFLNKKEVAEIISKIKYINTSYGEHVSLWFKQGDSNSPYIPKDDYNLRIFTNSSFSNLYIPYVQILTWMANNSCYRDDENRPCLWIDDRKVQLIDIGENNHELKDRELTKIKDGQYHKEFSKGFLSIVSRIITKEEDKFEKTKELICKLDSLYRNENSLTETNVKTKKKIN